MQIALCFGIINRQGGAAMKAVIRKYNGDDAYSWAVFRKEDLPKGHRGPVFYGESRRPPIVSGLSRSEANYHKKVVEKMG